MGGVYEKKGGTGRNHLFNNNKQSVATVMLAIIETSLPEILSDFMLLFIILDSFLVCHTYTISYI